MSRLPNTRWLRPMALVMALALIVSVTGAAAGSRVAAQAAPASAPNWWRAPEPKPSVWALHYQVLHVVDEKGTDQLVLVVTNPTRSRMVLTFPTSQRADFSLWREGAEWWRTSWDQQYAQVVTKDTLGPYQSRLYAASLPDWLPAGPYQVAAFLLADGNRHPVAWAQVWLDEGTQDASVLRFGLSYRQYGWEQTGRLGLSISNTTGQPVLLTYPQGWSVRVEVRDASDRVVWQQTIPAPARQETVRAGGARYHFFPLPSLAAGSYTARAWFAPAGDQPVALVSFTVR